MAQEPKIKIPAALLEDADFKWHKLCASARKARIDLPDRPVFVSVLKHVFALSDFVAQGCIRHPSILKDLNDSGDLLRPYDIQLYRHALKHVLGGGSVSTNTPAADIPPEGPGAEISNQIVRLQSQLRKYRLREMIRIAWRDLAGWAQLDDTMADLSALADACLDQSLTVLYRLFCRQYGVPTNPAGQKQYLVVIGMGKLGGYELNFSSDVDLIFAYAESGYTSGLPTRMSNEDFFSRLCRAAIRVIGEPTDEGFVFRVDARLRPDGENGPIVMNFDSLIRYYQYQGREWERYAWIKARVVAGDKNAGQELLKRLEPFVYRRYLDYGVFESLRDMKHMITMEVKRRGVEENIKLGPGGIREIEFFGQIFQLLRGGVLPALQDNRIQRVLKTLLQEGLVPAQICDDLTRAYQFLRMCENHIQQLADQQTHQLPVKPLDRIRLAASMQFSNWESFLEQLKKHMHTVHAHFERLLESRDSARLETAFDDMAENLAVLWQNLIEAEQDQNLLRRAGFENPKEVIGQLKYLRTHPETRALSSEGRKRLDRLIPLFLKEAALSAKPELVLKRGIDLLKNIQRRTNYIALLLENPIARSHLIELICASPWMATYLARHPVLLDELLDPRRLYVPTGKDSLQRDLRRRLVRVPRDDLEYQIEELCIFKQVSTLRVAAADVSGVLPLMKVSDYLSYIAETVLDEVVELSWDHLVQKHGRPRCEMSGNLCDKGFAIIGYGKLGGLELGYSSDLDLVFLHAGIRDRQQKGAKAIDTSQFFARLGQRVVHILTTHTAAGILYEADMRLRPSGSAGMLVSHYEAFADYQFNQAWAWEHQALLRARAIIGDPLLIQWFAETRRTVLTRKRDAADLRTKVVAIRERLRQEHARPRPDVFDLKHDAGGIVDIEFLVQYLILLNSHQHPALIQWTDNVRLLYGLAVAGILDEHTACFLRRTYLIYRAVAHRLSLQEAPAQVPPARFHDLRQGVIEIWNRHLKDYS